MAQRQTLRYTEVSKWRDPLQEFGQRLSGFIVIVDIVGLGTLQLATWVFYSSDGNRKIMIFLPLPKKACCMCLLALHPFSLNRYRSLTLFASSEASCICHRCWYRRGRLKICLLLQCFDFLRDCTLNGAQGTTLPTDVAKAPFCETV